MLKQKIKYVLLVIAIMLTTLLATGASAANLTATTKFSINRVYEGNDGSHLYLHVVGDEVYGFSESSVHGYAYVLHGTLNGDVISASFWDVPKQARTKTGTFELVASEAGQRLQWASSSTSIGAISWQDVTTTNGLSAEVPAAYQEIAPGNLTGAYTSDEDVHYFVREAGGQVVWVAETVGENGQMPPWVTVFIGERNSIPFPFDGETISTDIEGSYADMLKGERFEAGSFGATFNNARSINLYQSNPALVMLMEPNYAVDWDIFASEIQAALDGKAVGYAFEIGQGDTIMRSGAGGNRKLSGDGGPLPFTTSTQSQEFSTSKTVSAVAIVKALTDRGLTVNISIEPFLPDCWERDSGFELVTFADLLDHTSGVTTNGGDPYTALKDLVGTAPSLNEGYRYNNAAYALLRYLVPLVAYENDAKMIFVNNDCENDGDIINEQMSTLFAYYQEVHVLPLGAQMTYTPDENLEAYIYDRPFGYNTGVGPNPDGLLRAGAGYLATSVLDYGEFLGALVQGDIVPEPILQQMYNGNLGFDGPANGVLGTYYTKNGANGGDCGIRGSAQLMIYPNNMHGYIMVNSRVNTDTPWLYFDYNNNMLNTDDAAAPASINGGDIPVMGDFDGDNLDHRVNDIGFYRPNDRSWRYDFEMDGTIDLVVPNWGLSGDIPFAGDFDKDGDFDDVALFRPQSRKLFFDYNHDGTTNFQLNNWGMPCDLPVAGDFDGDGFANDVAVYRPSNSTRYYDYEHNGSIDKTVAGWGQSHHVPAVGDFDNDGLIDDFMLFDGGSGTRYYDFDEDTTTDLIREDYGGSGDIPLVGSLTGVNFVNDVILYRPSAGLARILQNAFDTALK